MKVDQQVTYRPCELHKGDVMEKWGKNWTIRDIKFCVEPLGVAWSILMSHDQDIIILIVGGDDQFKLIHRW